MRMAHRGIACAVVAFLISFTVSAAQYVVSQDGSGSFRTIQGALNAAAYGDVIYVNAGVYEEHLTFRNGVTLIGAGASQTIVRYAYGFDEVLLAEHVSSGRIEGLAIERAASILEGPTVFVSAGSLVISNCVVSGGIGAGLEVEASTSTVTLEAVTIEKNAGHGVWAHDGGRVVLADCAVQWNTGAGVLVEDDGSVVATDSAVQGNDSGGVVLRSTATAALDRCRIADHAGVGLLAEGDSTVVARDVELSDNGDAAVRLADDAAAALTRPTVRGGGDGIFVEERARLTLEAGMIRNVGGTGVRVTDTAVATVCRSEIVAGEGDGVALETSGACSITYSTVVQNVGDGVRISGGDAQVEHSILAYNGGVGLHVSDAADSTAVRTFSHNCVWDNGSDYVGTSMRPSDVAEAPSFADLASGDVSLRPDSSCVEAGSAWSTIGASGDPSTSQPITIDLLGTLSSGWFGETWHADFRAAGPPLAVESLDVGFLYVGRTTILSVASTLFGTWSRRVLGSASGGNSWALDGDASRSFSLRYGFAGAVAAEESWASLWGRGSFDGDVVHAIVQLGTNWPSTHVSSSVSVNLTSPLAVGVSVAAVDSTLKLLRLTATQRIVGATGILGLEERFRWLPDPLAEGTVTWSSDRREGEISVQVASAAWRASLAVEDQSLSVEADVHFVESAFSDGTLSLSVVLGALRLSAEAALTAEGTASIAMSLAADVTSWLRRAPNKPPVPSFVSEPGDPEAGSPVRFDAATSRDSDGEIREYWWDFGDGSADLGASVEHTYALPGTYEVVLTVSDDRGVTASLRLPVVVWPAKTSPVASFFAVPVSGGGIRIPRSLRAGDRVLLDASGSVDPDGFIVEYGWDLDSDGVVDALTSDPLMTVSPFSPGAHPVTLRVLDDTSRSDAVMRVVFVDRVEPPQAAFAFTPPTPAVDDPVYFSDRSADTDGSIVAWSWDFGDGRQSRDASPIHRFAEQGEYAVTLNVLDSDGLNGTASQRVVVSPTPEIVPVDEVWAVVIGISDYAQVRDIQFGRDDAVAMARWLLDANVPSDHVRLLLDTEGTVDGLDGATSGLATLVNVREALGWLRRVAGPNDLGLVFFSGHGFQGDDDDGDEKDGVDEFFVLLDTVASAPEDTALRDDEFGRFLDRLDSNHVLVFFDGCYSGGLSRSLPASKRPVGESQDLFSDFSLEGRLVFSAASESQDAFESPELGHGIFTYYVLAGLRGAADLNGDHRVTAWELYEYVAQAVPERARLERGVAQQPQLLGEGEVRVLLATTPGPPVAAFVYRPDVPYVGGAVEFLDESPGAIASSIWTFGDGGTATGRTARHVYGTAGSFAVSLRVTDEYGVSAVADSAVAVSPAGRVLSVDPEAGIVSISLGSENGVRSGDRFRTGSPAADAELVVVEILAPDVAACRVVLGEAPVLGAEVRLIPPAG